MKKEVVSDSGKESPRNYLCLWRPIETAPKDGTTILAWLYDSEVHIIRWGEQNGYDGWLQRDSDMMIWQPWKSESGVPEDWQMPTHWMPLPRPPATPDQLRDEFTDEQLLAAWATFAKAEGK